MAITPKQLMALTEQDQGRIKNMEAFLDAAIARAFNPTTRGDACVSIPRGVQYGDKMYLELVRRYEAAGWKVKYEADQRDGDYLVFTPKGGQR